MPTDVTREAEPDSTSSEVPTARQGSALHTPRHAARADFGNLASSDERLSSGIATDLGNYVAAIRLSAEFLDLAGGLSRSQAAAVSDIVTACSAAQEYIRDRTDGD